MNAAFPTSDSPARSRRVLRLTAVAVVVAVAGTGSAAAKPILGTSAGRAMPCALTSAEKARLAAESRLIRHEVGHSNSGSRSESWSDFVRQELRTTEFSGDGKLMTEDKWTRLGSAWRLDSLFGGMWITSRQKLGVAPLLDIDSLAQRYRAKVAAGIVKVVAHEAIVGRSTLHVRSSSRGTVYDTWVEAATYLPVRTRIASHGTWSETNAEWLPRTAGNVAKTKLVVPSGFSHQDSRTGSGSFFSVHPDNWVSVHVETIKFKVELGRCG